MTKVKRFFTFKQPRYLHKKVKPRYYFQRYLPRYLPLELFTFLPTGLLPFLVQILSKFRVILQIW